MTLQLTKYTAVQTDLSDEEDYLSPKSKGLYKQWQMDKKDELVVDGYFRNSKVKVVPRLPKEITHTIAAFYTKSASKAYLKSKILKHRNEIRELQAYKTWERAFKRGKEVPDIRILLLLLFICCVVSVDIAALIIINKYDCESSKVSKFLFIGSVAHIAAGLIVCALIVTVHIAAQCFPEDIPSYVSAHSIVNEYIQKQQRRRRCIYYIFMIYVCFITLFFISYSIIGLVLYSQTNEHHPCSDVLISWIVLKFVLYIAVAPFAVWFIMDDSVYQYDSDNKLLYNTFLRVCFSMAIIGLLFGPDIAGLIIATNNDCDLTTDGGGSKYVDFSVNTYLLAGCSVHLCCCVMIALCCCVYIDTQMCSCISSDVICIPLLPSTLFCIVWGIIGCSLYEEMDHQNNASNKQCADVMISWITLRILEPCLLFCAARFLLDRRYRAQLRQYQKSQRS
eukprot:86936_1